MPARNIDGTSAPFKPSRKPILIDLVDMYNTLDPELKKIQKMSIKDNPRNRETAYWGESICQSLARITIAQIIGDGLKIKCDKNPKVEEIIDGWNRQINVRREPVEKYISDSWIDSLIHKNSFYRVMYNRNLKYKIDIQRLDPKTIEVQDDPKYGWRAFIQKLGDYKAHRSKYAFYRNVITDDEKGAMKNPIGQYYYTAESSSGVTRNVIIPDEPSAIIYTDFFKKAPVASIMRFISYKQVIALFMRKYSQKHWAPFLLAFVGDQYHYPELKEEMQESIDYTAQQLQKIVSFGAAAFPGNVEIKALETSTASSSEIYVLYMDAMNKEIMWGLHSSMSLREASGRELSTSNTIKQGEYQYIQGARRSYEIKLTDFYANCLLPANGITDTEPQDIDIEFSPLRPDDPQALAQSILLLRQAGVFKDKNEIRKAASPMFAFLNDLPEKENEKFDTDILTQKETGPLIKNGPAKKPGQIIKNEPAKKT